MPTRPFRPIARLFLVAAVSFPITVAVVPAAFAQNDALAEKEREIRNLRRRIFDLESQIPTDSRQQELTAEIKRLKQAAREDRDRLESEHRRVEDELRQQIRQLELELASQKKDLERALKDAQAKNRKDLEAQEAAVTKKEKQIVETNEILTREIAERSAAEAKLSELQKEFQRLRKEQAEMAAELADRRQARQRLVARTEKPLREKIDQLEGELSGLRRELTQREARQRELSDELKDHQRRLSAVQSDWEKAEREREAVTAALAEAERQQESAKAVRKEMKAALKEAAEQKEAALNDLRGDHQKAIRDKERQLDELTQKMELLQQDLKERTAKHEDELAELRAKAQAGQEALRETEARIAEATRPLKEKMARQEEAVEKQRIKLESAREKRELLNSQLAEKDDRIAVYQKLVDKQESDLKELRQKSARDTAQWETALAAEKDPLLKQIEGLRKEKHELEKKLQIRDKELEKEYLVKEKKWQEELSSLKIDLEYQTNKNAKLEEGQEELENTLIALQKNKESLREEVARLTAKMDAAAADGRAARKALSEKAELQERLEILLQENADYQKKVLELTESLKGITNAEQIAQELSEAQSLIIGFKKDVDAKTIEISGLVSENHDLRRKLRQTIKEADEWQQQLDKLKAEQMAKISDEEVQALQEQVNSLRTALSKARQMIAQKDVALDDVVSDRETLRSEVNRLTVELNAKIKSLGELEYAQVSRLGGYSEEDLQAAKKPLLVEISVLKQRIEHLEKQLVETWNRAEGMLLELKNHPQIKQAGGPSLLDAERSR